MLIMNTDLLFTFLEYAENNLHILLGVYTHYLLIMTRTYIY